MEIQTKEINYELLDCKGSKVLGIDLDCYPYISELNSIGAEILGWSTVNTVTEVQKLEYSYKGKNIYLKVLYKDKICSKLLDYGYEDLYYIKGKGLEDNYKIMYKEGTK